MAGERNFLRVPPDSTGKRVRMKHTAQIHYSGKSTSENPSYLWTIGERYTIAGIGSCHLHGYWEQDNDSGILEVHLPQDSTYTNLSATVGGNIVDIDTGDQVALVAEQVDVFINVNHIVGYDNPEYAANVDRFGSLYTRFTEGPAELSALGSLKVSAGQTLASYQFQNNILPQNFSNTLLSGGSVTHDGGIKAAVISCPTTSGAKATHTSNFYHPYVNGSVNTSYMATRIGDSGKTNVVRSWGAFDATDGILFQLNGTALRVVHRYTFNGTTSNHSIEQADWNKDKLDGTGSSGVVLDVTQNNLYWVDFQNVGKGYARWGIIVGGEKIVCHEMAASMADQHNLLGNPHRPICWAQANTGASGSTSEMYAYGASVVTDNQELDYENRGDLRRFSTSGTIPSTSTSTTYFFTMSPNLYLANGDLNHSYYTPQKIKIAALDSTNDDDVKVEIRIFQKCQVRGQNFKPDAFSTTEFDTDGNHLGHGPEMFKQVISGVDEINVSQYLNDLTNTVHNSSEAETAVRTQLLTSITNASPAIITVGTNPLTGQTRHLFDDLDPVTIENVTQPDAAAALNNNQYYLSYTSSSKAALYSVLADLQDDRATRVLTVDSTLNVAVDDTITIDGTYTATVVAFDASTIEIAGRSSLLIDGVTAVPFTTTSGGSGTVSSVAVSASTHYPKDYDTYLKAVDGSGWAAAATDGDITGQPPSQPAWTFMARHLTTKSNDTSVRWTVYFKENIQ